MRQARNIDGCFFIRRYSENVYDYSVILHNYLKIGSFRDFVIFIPACIHIAS